MTSLEQLDLWIAGQSKCPNDREECCPDFSCCVSGTNTDVKLKKAFKKAYLDGDNKLMMHILSGFLPNLLNNENVHIVGQINEHNEIN